MVRIPLRGRGSSRAQRLSALEISLLTATASAVRERRVSLPISRNASGPSARGRWALLLVRESFQGRPIHYSQFPVIGFDRTDIFEVLKATPDGRARHPKKLGKLILCNGSITF